MGTTLRVAEYQMPTYRFVDTGPAPEFFASGLHDVELIGSVARLLLYTLRHAGEELIGEPALSVIIPVEALGPGVALTVQRCGSRLILPAPISTAKALLVH